MILIKYKIKRLVEERWQRLYRVAYSWCHDTQLAKDLVQDTVMKALKNYHQIRDLEMIDAWIFKILLNAWHDSCRSQKDHIEFIETDFQTHTTPESEQQRNGVITRVRKAIANLNAEYREVVTLIDLEEFSYKEVADILQIPIGTVMSRLCRARRQLKTSLSDIHQGEARIRRIK